MDLFENRYWKRVYDDFLKRSYKKVIEINGGGIMGGIRHIIWILWNNILFIKS